MDVDSHMWQLGVELNVTGLASNGVAAAWAGTAAHFTAFHPTNGQHVTAVIPVAADGTAVGTLTLGHTPRADGPDEAASGAAALWSPDSPALYNATVKLVSAGQSTPLDSFSTYFGLRTIKIELDDAGIPRPMLNGKFVFQVGTLDQGFVSLDHFVASSVVCLD